MTGPRLPGRRTLDALTQTPKRGVSILARRPEVGDALVEGFRARSQRAVDVQLSRLRRWLATRNALSHPVKALDDLSDVALVRARVEEGQGQHGLAPNVDLEPGACHLP